MHSDNSTFSAFPYESHVSWDSEPHFGSYHWTRGSFTNKRED